MVSVVEQGLISKFTVFILTNLAKCLYGISAKKNVYKVHSGPPVFSGKALLESYDHLSEY